MTCFFSVFVLSQKAFWLCFPLVSGQGFLASGWFFSRVSPIPFFGPVGSFGCGVTHPFFGPGSAFLGVVSWFFWPFSPVSIVCQDFLVSFSGGFGPCVFVHTFCYSFNFRSSFLWRVGPCGQPSGSCFGPFFPFGFVSFFISSMVFACTNTCVVHVPAAIISHEKSRVFSFLEEVVDFNKLSAVQFIPRGLIRLTFKELADKERLVSQGSIVLENVECDVTPSDRPYTMVYVHHYPAEGDDALLLEQFRRFGKIVATKHQHFSGRPSLLTGSRILTMSLSQQIPAEVFVDSYPTRVWYRGMAPFCQICKSMGHKAADCEHNGKCRECGEVGHLARACPSRRGGRAWGVVPVPASATPPADAQSFPPLGAPSVSAETDVPVISETISSMEAEDSQVSSGLPSVSDVTLGTSGVSLLAALEDLVSDIKSVDNESVNNEIVDNDLVENERVVNVIESNIKENVVNVEINESNLVNDTESNDSQASGSMECSSSPCVSSFSSPSGPPDSLDQLLAAGRKRSKRTIVPSVAVAAASIVKRSKAVPGAGVQKKKSK